MKLIINKIEDDIRIKIQKDGVDTEFEYISFINDLCNNEVIEEVIYSTDIVEWEQTKINDLIEKIREAIIVDEEDNDEELVNEIDF